MDRTIGKCPRCGGEVKERPRSYCCSCGLVVWKEVAGRRIPEKVVRRLLAEGKSGLLDGFVSRQGRRFSAELVLQDGKVSLVFPDKKDGGPEPARSGGGGGKNGTVVPVRLQADSSGTCRLEIGGPVNAMADVPFGLVPARMAECLGAIAAVRIAAHRLGDEARRAAVELSLNNLDFSKYLLQEKRPREKEMQDCLAYLWRLLEGFACWHARFQPARRPRLEGGRRRGSSPGGSSPGLRPGSKRDRRACSCFCRTTQRSWPSSGPPSGAAPSGWRVATRCRPVQRRRCGPG